MLDSFFHIKKPRKFYITPRFYDPVKEERELREKRIKMEMGINEKEGWESSRKVDYHGTFRKSKSTAGSKTLKEAKIRSNKRLLVLILILAMIAYLYLKF